MVAADADYLVELVVDGTPVDIILLASDADAVEQQIRMDWGRGAMIVYRTPKSPLVPVRRIIWKNVATLQFGPVEMVRDYRPKA